MRMRQIVNRTVASSCPLTKFNAGLVSVRRMMMMRFSGWRTQRQTANSNRTYYQDDATEWQRLFYTYAVQKMLLTIKLCRTRSFGYFTLCMHCQYFSCFKLRLTTFIKRILMMMIVKRFSVDNFLSPESVPKMAVFRELLGVNVKFLSSNPEQAHPCAEPRHVTYYAWKSVQASRL